MSEDKNKKEELVNVDKLDLLDAETLLEQDMEEVTGGDNYCGCATRARA